MGRSPRARRRVSTATPYTCHPNRPARTMQLHDEAALVGIAVRFDLHRSHPRLHGALARELLAAILYPRTEPAFQPAVRASRTIIETVIKVGLDLLVAGVEQHVDRQLVAADRR